MNKGSRLELSDGSAYEVNPEDRVYSVYWITPFPVELGKTGDRDYPIKITNLNTLSFVRAKKITIAQLRERPPGSEQTTPKSTMPQEEKDKVEEALEQSLAPKETTPSTTSPKSTLPQKNPQVSP